MTHALKTWPVYFQAITDGRKRFEVRKNDRDFQVGDQLRLMEWDPKRRQRCRDCGELIPGTKVCRDPGRSHSFVEAEEIGFTGREMIVEVTYMFVGGSFGLAEDHCIMSIAVQKACGHKMYDPYCKDCQDEANY